MNWKKQLKGLFAAEIRIRIKDYVYVTVDHQSQTPNCIAFRPVLSQTEYTD